MIMKARRKSRGQNKWLKLAMIIAIVVIGFPIGDTAWSRDSGINCRNCNSSVLFVCSDCNRLCGSGDGRCCAFAAGIEACSPIRVWDLRFLEQD